MAYHNANINLLSIDARNRGDYYRENFATYWSPDRLLELSRDRLRAFKQNILNADLDCDVKLEDREIVLSRIDAYSLVI